MWQEVSTLEERRRSMSIRLYGLDRMQDEGPRADLDEIAAITQHAMGGDGAGINLLVDDVQVTVGTSGDPVDPMPRLTSICSVALSTHPGAELIEFADMREVAELRDNPFVDGRIASFRFYAAAPLVGKHGLALGTLCAWSERKKSLDHGQRLLLRHLGRAVVNVLDERRRLLVPDIAGRLRPGAEPARRELSGA